MINFCWIFAGYRPSSWTLFSRRTRDQRSKDDSKYPRRFIHLDDWKHLSGSLRGAWYFPDGMAAVLERCTRRTLFTLCLLSLQSGGFGKSSAIVWFKGKRFCFSRLFFLIMQIPGYVVETFVFVSIAYWLMGLKPEAGAFFYSCWVLIVTCNTAAACG